MLNFLKNYYLDLYKLNVLTYVVNLKLFNLVPYLMACVSSNMMIFFFQLSLLINKNVIIFGRVFFVELVFKRWVALSFFVFSVLLFFI